MAHAPGERDLGYTGTLGVVAGQPGVERFLEIKAQQGTALSQFGDLAAAKVEMAGAGAGFGEAEHAQEIAHQVIRAMTPASPARRYQLRLAIGARAQILRLLAVGLGPRLQITQRTGESARLE